MQINLEEQVDKKEVLKKFGSLFDKKKFVVLDLELTCWADEREPDEIIQFSYVVVPIIDRCISQDSISVLDFGDFIIRPEKDPILSDFCTSLTGITQEQVDEAPTFKETFELFKEEIISDWSDSIAVCWGRDLPYVQKKCKELLSWGDWIDPRYINLKYLINSRMGLKDTLKFYELEQVQPAHDALADARSTTLLAQKLEITTECAMVSSTKTYKEAMTSYINRRCDLFGKRHGLSREESYMLLKKFGWDFSKASSMYSFMKDFIFKIKDDE